MNIAYADWLRYIFDRPTTENRWFFDLELEPFDPEPAATVALIGQTCERSGVDLMAFSDEQVRAGLDFIFNASCSNLAFALKDESVPPRLSHATLARIEDLYRQCFAVRCAPAASHLDEQPSTPLNSFCYMLWDVSPLTSWGHDARGTSSCAAVLDVLEKCLYIDHTACVESALHGLGHLHFSAPAPVQSVVDRWLSSSGGQHSPLRRYAEAVRVGRVQ